MDVIFFLDSVFRVLEKISFFRVLSLFYSFLLVSFRFERYFFCDV